jgi:hypothetical protein
VKPSTLKWSSKPKNPTLQVLNLKAGLGWRATHFVVVAFGLAMAAVATQVIKDPVRDDPTHDKADDKADDKAESVGVVETVSSVLEGVVTSAREVFSVPAMRLLYTAGAVCSPNVPFMFTECSLNGP